MKKIVIIGASGFVGRSLTAHLLDKGFDVYPVTRQNIRGMLCVDTYLDCPRGDVLIHLAEEANRGKVNNLGVSYKNEIEHLTSFLARKFSGNVIYASSSVVYGDKNPVPNTELTEVIGSDLYSNLKLQNEKIILEGGGTVARISNLYGRGMSQSNVISDIFKQVPGKSSLKLRDVLPIKDFLYIDDLLSAFELLVAASYNGILNLGSGKGVSIYKLAKIVLALVNQKEREIVSTHSSGVESINVLNISKINKAIGWRPSSCMEKSLLHLLHNREKINEKT